MTDSAEAYEVHAHDFLRARDRSQIGAQVVERWSRTLRQGAAVIELACGGGYPVTRVLEAAAGLRLWALDSSPTLVAEFRSRFPAIPVRCARVQDSDFFGRQYDGVVAIGLIFLRPEAEQANLIARVSALLLPGGRFLFMAPIQVGTWNDMNTGIGCRSLGQARYEQLLRDAGLRVVATHADAGANDYYAAEKVAQGGGSTR